MKLRQSFNTVMINCISVLRHVFLVPFEDLASIIGNHYFFQSIIKIVCFKKEKVLLVPTLNTTSLTRLRFR